MHCTLSRAHVTRLYAVGYARAGVSEHFGYTELVVDDALGARSTR